MIVVRGSAYARKSGAGMRMLSVDRLIRMVDENGRVVLNDDGI
jgi:hypothetical protein